MRKFPMRRFLLTLCFLLALPLHAAVNVSPLFVHLSDAMSAVKQGNAAAAAPPLDALAADFAALPQDTSAQAVQQALAAARHHPDDARLETLARALYAYEKAQNPVDHTQQRQRFAKRVLPVYQVLHHAVLAHDMEALPARYKRFNNTWTANEKTVRDASLGHYGQIETAMNFLRIAMLAEPPDTAAMQQQSAALGAALDDFIAGNTAANTASEGAQTLRDGVALLEQALASDDAQAAENLALFIRQWPVFEGEVRTRDAALYTQTESELPHILATLGKAESRAKLQSLTAALAAINPDARYGILDAMLILLREGTEALLIVMALLAALNAAGQTRGKRWIYAGAATGIAASIAAALALQRLFPAVAAGANREILEGLVGIVAVCLMLAVGGWLHSKSSLQGWQRFVERHLGAALATGSLLSLAGLSFLAVFREGAETLLFYAGMLPRMTLADFFSGIALALALLAILAAVLHKSGQRLPVHQLFRVMTWLIYALGFKILGVSLHALQLTRILPAHHIDSLPALPAIGWYPSWEGLAAQALYLALIPLAARWFK
ncbi:MAG: FTR1 family protein [Cardiobacteriaceae bacterium]|nr:FTR1 family protein [Cardiobacteriaceae bacterium]